MAVVAVAITLSFHIKAQPSAVELRMARPLGLVFWVLAVACLAMGLGNYISTCVCVCVCVCVCTKRPDTDHDGG